MQLVREITTAIQGRKGANLSSERMLVSGTCTFQDVGLFVTDCAVGMPIKIHTNTQIPTGHCMRLNQIRWKMEAEHKAADTRTCQSTQNVMYARTIVCKMITDTDRK